MSEFEKAVTGLGEECGVFGAYDMDGHDVAASIYYGLFALQHRGQESCGIAVTDTAGKRKVLSRKGLGHVNDVFDEKVLSELKGNLGVGHVRYSTAGGTRVENAQPLVINYVKGTLAIAHNGNLVNAIELRKELEYTGAIFQTTIDSEVIAYHIARERLEAATAEEAVRLAMKKIKGAYALVVSSPRKMIGARDPFGLKPLCIGKRENTYFLASESCAIAAVDAEFVRDVLPGEIVTITKDGIASDMSMAMPAEKQARCIFEYIYFARTDSTIDGVNVYHSRIIAGKALAESYPVEADLVVGVPDSGLVAAKGYSEQSGIPYGMAFHKNSYVVRACKTFRACLKNGFRKLRVPVCGRFCPNEGGLRPLRQPNEGKLYRKVGLAACGNAFSDTLQDQIRFYVAGNFSELSCHAKNQPQKPFRKTVADALPSTFSESHR